jgi:hypothetical protein
MQLVEPVWELPPDAAHRHPGAKRQTRCQNRPDIGLYLEVSPRGVKWWRIATGRAKSDPTRDLRGALPA